VGAPPAPARDPNVDPHDSDVGPEPLASQCAQPRRQQKEKREKKYILIFQPTQHAHGTEIGIHFASLRKSPRCWQRLTRPWFLSRLTSPYQFKLILNPEHAFLEFGRFIQQQMDLRFICLVMCHLCGTQACLCSCDRGFSGHPLPPEAVCSRLAASPYV
jgi:hypothetical protein